MEYDESEKDGTYLFALKGKLTFKDHEEFQDMIRVLDSEGVKVICIDFSELEYIDSSGLSMLLIAKEKTEQNSAKLILQNLSEDVQRVFGVSKFDTLFEIVQNS